MTNLGVLGISGSLRKNSWNTSLLRVAAKELPQGMKLEVFNLATIPMYNADMEGASMPEAVVEFKSKIASSDALLIATPEYNYSIPGVLKNAIDWASRNMKDSPLNGKPVAIVGVGGMMGTVRAQLHLRQILLHNGTMVLPKPEVYIARGWEKFDMHGNLIDEEARRSIRTLMESLHAWIVRLNPAVQSPVRIEAK